MESSRLRVSLNESMHHLRGARVGRKDRPQSPPLKVSIPSLATWRFVISNRAGELSDIQQTALVTLWARCFETRRRRPSFVDSKAVQISQAFDFDLNPYRKGRFTQIGIRLRTLEFDRFVEGYVDKHPDTVVVEFGAGLNSRHVRVDCRPQGWYDFDEPAMTRLRRRVFEETDHHRIRDGSIYSQEWCDELSHFQPTQLLIICEGVLMYFEPTVVKNFFQTVGRHFPGATVCFDVLGEIALRRRHRHELHQLLPPFRWGIERIEDVERLAPSVRLLDSIDLSGLLTK